MPQAFNEDAPLALNTYLAPDIQTAFTLLPDKIANGGYDLAVSASEIIQQLPKLSDAERQAVLDKLRELAQVDDDRWEEIINEPTPRPKLQAFIEQATAEGSEPLDLNRM